MPKPDLSHIANDLRPLARATNTLKPDPRNARTHSERNTVATMKSLMAYGQQKPIVVLKDGTIIAGNGTLTAATRLLESGLQGKPDPRWSHLAVSTFDTVSDAKDAARGYAIADNRTAELAEWDFETLAETFKEIPQADWDATGFLEYEIDPLLKAEFTPPEKSDLPNRHKGFVIALTSEEWDIFGEACARLTKKSGRELTRGEALVLLCKGLK